ncbi:hypothetical protein BC831DRAFT_480382 [Entophlyctis helioformis]|nr:hypothetical protein BC831DRAFT_480382 [Entophlyctis helioformis]
MLSEIVGVDLDETTRDMATMAAPTAPGHAQSPAALLQDLAAMVPKPNVPLRDVLSLLATTWTLLLQQPQPQQPQQPQQQDQTLALLPSLRLLKLRLLRLQQSPMHQQTVVFMQWALPMLANHGSMNINGTFTDSNVGAIVATNLRSAAMRSLSDLLVLCVEREYENSDGACPVSEAAITKIMFDFTGMHQLWVIPMLVDRLPHCIIPVLHRSINSHFCVAGNAVMDNMVWIQKQAQQQQQNMIPQPVYPPLLLFVGELMEHAAKAWPDCFAESVAALLDTYQGDIASSTRVSDPPRPSQFTLAYLLTVAILSPSTFQVCQERIMTRLVHSKMTMCALAESTSGYSQFKCMALALGPFEPLTPLLPVLWAAWFSASVSRLGLFYSLRVLLELSNWCTFVENRVTRQSGTPNEQLASMQLASNLDTCFNNWLTIVLSSSQSSPLISIPECRLLLAKLAFASDVEDQSVSPRQGSFVQLVAKIMSSMDLAQVLSVDGFRWLFHEQAATAMVNTHPNLPKDVLAIALALYRSGNTDRRALVHRLPLELALPQSSLAGHVGLTAIRRLLLALGLAHDSKSSLTGTDLSAGMQWLTLAAMSIDCERLEPLLHFQMAFSVLDQLELDYFASINGAAAGHDSHTDSSAGMAAPSTSRHPMATATMMQIVSLFSKRQRLAALVVHLIRRVIFSSDAHTRALTRSPFVDMLFVCAMQPHAKDELAKIVCSELMSSSNDLVSLFLAHEWLWAFMSTLASGCPGRAEALQHLGRVADAVKALLERHWSRRQAKMAKESPPELACSQGLVGFLLKACTIPDASAGLLGTSAWLLEYLSGKQTVVLFGIWSSISRLPMSPDASQIDKHMNLHARQIAALWKAVMVRVDSSRLSMLAPLLVAPLVVAP